MGTVHHNKQDRLAFEGSQGVPIFFPAFHPGSQIGLIANTGNIEGLLMPWAIPLIGRLTMLSKWLA
jgi:hypothetical protein